MKVSQLNTGQLTRRQAVSKISAIAAGVTVASLDGQPGQGRAVGTSGLYADEPESPRQNPLPTELSGPDSDGPKSDSVPWLQKTVKAGMIRIPKANDWSAKLQAAKEAGFAGVEPNTGKLDVAAFRTAADKVGITIDGTVGGYHWGTTHTNPDPQVRQRAQELLTASIQQTHDLGANTFLIVPGHGKDGTHEEVRQRAFDAIAKAIPLADRLGVHILIENVWNHFLYDHQGDSNQSVQPLADFVDSFGTDTVGVQYDLGNHWKYGDVAEWVMNLGDRIQKLDIKGFSRQKNKFTDITEGDIDWPSVEKALMKIKFKGWLAAEVGGGDQARLTKVAGQMDQALNCNRVITS